MQAEPSSRQKDVLDAIVRYQREHGFPPSIRELRALVGIASTNGGSEHLRALERKGWITRVPYESRAIALTKTALARYGCPCCGSGPADLTREEADRAG